MDGDLHRPTTWRVRVDDDGAITLPAAVSERLEVAPGDRLYIYPSLKGGLILRKVIDDDFTRRLEALRGTAGAGPTTEEMMEMTRGEPEA